MQQDAGSAAAYVRYGVAEEGGGGIVSEGEVKEEAEGGGGTADSVRALICKTTKVKSKPNHGFEIELCFPAFLEQSKRFDGERFKTSTSSSI